MINTAEALGFSKASFSLCDERTVLARCKMFYSTLSVRSTKTNVSSFDNWADVFGFDVVFLTSLLLSFQEFGVSWMLEGTILNEANISKPDAIHTWDLINCSRNMI